MGFYPLTGSFFRVFSSSWLNFIFRVVVGCLVRSIFIIFKSGIYHIFLSLFHVVGSSSFGLVWVCFDRSALSVQIHSGCSCHVLGCVWVCFDGSAHSIWIHSGYLLCGEWCDPILFLLVYCRQPVILHVGIVYWVNTLWFICINYQGLALAFAILNPAFGCSHLPGSHVHNLWVHFCGCSPSFTLGFDPSWVAGMAVVHVGPTSTSFYCWPWACRRVVGLGFAYVAFGQPSVLYSTGESSSGSGLSRTYG